MEAKYTNIITVVVRQRPKERAAASAEIKKKPHYLSKTLRLKIVVAVVVHKDHLLL